MNSTLPIHMVPVWNLSHGFPVNVSEHTLIFHVLYVYLKNILQSIFVLLLVLIVSIR